MEIEIESNIKQQNGILVENAIKRYSDKTKYDYNNKIQIDLKFLYDLDIRYLLDYEIEHWQQLFDFIESKPITKDCKKRYRYYLRNVIQFALKKEISEGKIERLGFFNYIFSDKFCQFSESGTKYDYIHIKPKEIQDFLAELFQAKIRDYILFGILAYSGCRAAGIINLKVKDINFEERYFTTQEKKTRDSSGYNRYFLPGVFLSQLKVFIAREQLQPDQQLAGFSYENLDFILKTRRNNWRLHLFRHAIRVNWHEKGMPDLEAQFLLNHKPASIDQTYLKSLNTIEHLREVYDKFFPY